MVVSLYTKGKADRFIECDEFVKDGEDDFLSLHFVKDGSDPKSMVFGNDPDPDADPRYFIHEVAVYVMEKGRTIDRIFFTNRNPQHACDKWIAGASCRKDKNVGDCGNCPCRIEDNTK